MPPLMLCPGWGVLCVPGALTPGACLSCGLLASERWRVSSSGEITVSRHSSPS